MVYIMEASSKYNFVLKKKAYDRNWMQQYPFWNYKIKETKWYIA